MSIFKTLVFPLTLVIIFSAFSSLASVADTEKIDLISAPNSYSLWSTIYNQDNQLPIISRLDLSFYSSVSVELEFVNWMTSARNKYFLIDSETTESAIFLTANFYNASDRINYWQQPLYFDLVIPAYSSKFLKITLNHATNLLNWNLRPIAQTAPEQNVLMLLLHTFTKVMTKLRRFFAKCSTDKCNAQAAQ
ncbi:hypothetical protein [Chromatium okenii]|nr:hypothetical protein [Chromatium okenii]MBV5310654.1 hypothetical protein [Chromatium okenii]